MSYILKDIPAGKVAEELAKLGVSPDTRVDVVPSQDIREIAARMREYARQQGMTNELFEELMKDES
jgi:hypothetical protein